MLGSLRDFGEWSEDWGDCCSTVPYHDHLEEMKTVQKDGCYCVRAAYTRPAPFAVVPQETDVGQPIAAGVGMGHMCYDCWPGLWPRAYVFKP